MNQSMSIILLYLPYAFITAYTPGPNNLLSLHAFSQNGFRKGLYTTLGIFIGLFCVMSYTAFLSFEFSYLVPIMVPYLKYIGVVYIFWLAYHILRSKPHESSISVNSNIKTAFLLQFMNVKIFLYALTIYNAYIIPNTDSIQILLFSVCVNTLVGISGTIVWGLAGSLLQNQFKKHFKGLNALMALALVYSAIHILID